MANNKENFIFKELIYNEIYSLIDTFNAYSKVDASLSEKTLLNVLASLQEANIHLEKGFINDACEEVESKLEN